MVPTGRTQGGGAAEVRGGPQQQVKCSSGGVEWEAAQRHGQINKRGQQGSRTEARRLRGCEERSEKGKQGWHDRTETIIEQRNTALRLESCT